MNFLFLHYQTLSINKKFKKSAFNITSNYYRCFSL